ncbi:hypothetical protein ACRRBH_003859, partial [Escherichia coli]
MTSLKTSIKTITYLSDTGCLEIQGASLPGLFSVNANKYFIYIDEQKTVTEYRRPVPGRESVTRVTDTVSDAIEDTPQYRLKLVNGPDADSDNGKNSENTEDITESVKAPGADIAT